MENRNDFLEVVKDFMGWSVVNHKDNKVERGFLSKEDAEEYKEKELKALFQGSGVVL